MSAVIDVLCFVAPTGETLWVDMTDKPKDYGNKIISEWREQNPEYVDEKYSMGVVNIRMPLENYNNIPATNSFDWPKEEV